MRKAHMISKPLHFLLSRLMFVLCFQREYKIPAASLLASIATIYIFEGVIEPWTYAHLFPFVFSHSDIMKALYALEKHPFDPWNYIDCWSPYDIATVRPSAEWISFHPVSVYSTFLLFALYSITDYTNERPFHQTNDRLTEEALHNIYRQT